VSTNSGSGAGPEPDRAGSPSNPDTALDDGPPSATVVPHVVGHHVDLALRMLEDLGLRARVVTTEFHDKTDRHVVSTQPPAGSPAPRGFIVEVVMGIAPTVADYLGHDADDAVRLGEVAGHVVETVLADGVTRRQTTDVVIAQEPDPGERSRVLLLWVGPAGAEPTTTTT